MKVKLAVVLTVTTLYAMVRYVVFGGVSPIHLPLYVLNKSIAMTAAIALSIGVVSHFRGHKESSRHWGVAAWHLVILHVLMSLVLLGSSYYPKFFESGSFNLIGELSMLFGILATYGLWLLGTRKQSHGMMRPLMLGVLAAVGLHLIPMGVPGWVTTGHWHGSLPPISLLSFLVILISLCLAGIGGLTARKSRV